MNMPPENPKATRGTEKRFGMRPGAQRHLPAFTLIEVLVALAIFAIASVALGTAYINLISANAAIQQADSSDDDLHWVRIQFLKTAKLEDVERGDDVVLPGERTARWKATVEPTTVSDLFTAVLEVEMPKADTHETITVTETYTLLRPTWSEEADRKKLRDDAKKRLDDERARML